MAGLSSIGVYVPPRRVPAGGAASGSGARRSRAGSDEDVLTMAVDAAHRCLEEVEPLTLGGLFFASSTSGAPHRPMAPAVATVCDLPRDIVTADFGGSPRAGLSAVVAAARAVDTGVRRVLVVAADGGSQEPATCGPEAGDGAVAVVVDSRATLGTIAGSAAVAADLAFQIGDPSPQAPRHGLRDLAEVIERAINECGLGADQVASLALGGAVAPLGVEVARLVGIPLAGEPLASQLGHLATADVLLRLAAALENAGAGARVVAAASGAGAEALLLEVGDWEEGRGRWLDAVRSGAWRPHGASADGGGPEAPGSGRPASGEADVADGTDLEWRTRLYGKRCSACASVEFPGASACAACGAATGLEPAKLARRGRIHAVRGGAEVTVELTDGVRVDVPATDFLDSPAVPGAEVRLTFRRTGPGARHRYAWKARPV